MRVFFSADAHFGHPNICIYTGRPWVKDGELLEPYRGGKPAWAEGAARTVARRMSDALVNNWNSRVGVNDTVFHIGDFCTWGKAYDIRAIETKAQSWESVLNGKIIHIKGNHDGNNGIKHAIDMATITITGKRVLLRHHPPSEQFPLPDIPFDYMLCGHVHEKWRTRWWDGIWVYNVGVDVNKYAPVRLDEVAGLHQKESREYDGTIKMGEVVDMDIRGL